MPQTCTVCRHARRNEIDGELLGGATLRDVARRTGLSKDALARHKASDIPKALAVIVEAREEAAAETLFEKIRRLEDDARRLLGKAEAEGDLRAAIGATKTALDVVALFQKAGAEAAQAGSGALDPAAWAGVRLAVLAAVEPFPDARTAILEALRGFDARR